MLGLLWSLLTLPLTIFLAILWPTWDLVTFLLPFFVIFLIVRVAIGDADLKLQFYEKYGKKPGKSLNLQDMG